MPASPVSIFTAPTKGGTKTAPQSIYVNIPLTQIRIVVSGVTTVGVNGTYFFAGTWSGRNAWSLNGTLVASATNPIMYYEAGAYKLVMGSLYAASITSAASNPSGLTSWTLTVGTGSPTIAIYGSEGADLVYPNYAPPTVSAPPVVFTP
jgi:hypothetical protein